MRSWNIAIILTVAISPGCASLCGCMDIEKLPLEEEVCVSKPDGNGLACVGAYEQEVKWKAYEHTNGYVCRSPEANEARNQWCLQ